MHAYVRPLTSKLASLATINLKVGPLELYTTVYTVSWIVVYRNEEIDLNANSQGTRVENQASTKQNNKRLRSDNSELREPLLGCSDDVLALD